MNKVGRHSLSEQIDKKKQQGWGAIQGHTAQADHDRLQNSLTCVTCMSVICLTHSSGSCDTMFWPLSTRS